MNSRKSLVILFLPVLMLVFSLGMLAQDEEESFSLTIMHTNDTHSYHEPDGDGNGGVARQATVVKEIRAEVENSVLLDAGDRFTGTLYHTTYVGQDQVQIMNLLGYDAMTLGNHEFDNGDEILAAFIEGLGFPVVSTNIDFSGSDLLVEATVPYAILEVGGQQIGIIGLTTADTPIIANPGDELVFSDDYATVANEAAAELTEQGVNKIILVTHVGYGVYEELIPDLENIDVVVDGHSHTLFSNAFTGSIGGARSSGEYPQEFADATGSTVYYVQAGQYTKYLGRLDVEFDAAGVVTSAGGDVILLSPYIEPDLEASVLIAELSVPVQALRDTPINAETSVFLTGQRNVCRVEECTLGNLIADALRAETGAQIAIVNAGGIRSDIEEGDITLGEVLTVQPFGNTTSTFSATGADIVAALENGVSTIVVEDGVVARADLSGRFPQVSGIRYSFDPNLEAGSRIVGVDVQAEDGTFSPIDLEATYTVVTNNFVRNGGDGYSIFAENAVDPYDFGRVDYEVLADYLAANTPVAPEVEGRITMVNATVAPLE